MIAHVYRPKRKRGGQTIVARMYRARVQLPGEHKVRDIGLGVTEVRSAQQKLQQLLAEASRESVGLIPKKSVREAASIRFAQHVGNYLGDLRARGRVPRYVHGVEVYLTTLARECRWNYLGDVSAESLTVWRQRQKKSAKTLNEYLTAARAFLKWSKVQRLIEENPLLEVAPVRVAGRQARSRRAYTADEIQRLLQVAGPRRPLYLTAVLTGIRRGELEQLR